MKLRAFSATKTLPKGRNLTYLLGRRSRYKYISTPWDAKTLPEASEPAFWEWLVLFGWDVPMHQDFWQSCFMRFPKYVTDDRRVLWDLLNVFSLRAQLIPSSRLAYSCFILFQIVAEWMVSELQKCWYCCLCSHVGEDVSKFDDLHGFF